tara:strand:- start:1091 stop:1972 length:882 start_codon:yes stop_codon:yes gene_type:complete
MASFLNQAQSVEINLWDSEISGAIENPNYKEVKIYKDSILQSTSKVSVPTLTIFKPKIPNGTSVVIFPGGGYHHLAMNKEGYKVAQFLNNLGITAFVLKYRLPDDAIMGDKQIGPLQDAQEAIRYVRRTVTVFNLDENKIGVLGFSAGGHLAATLSTRFTESVYKVKDDISAKINFSILIYPVISMDSLITHQGSKTNLLGNSPSKEKTRTFSNEKQVSPLTPKTFLVHATDDTSVSVENSINYYLALKAHNIPVEMHVYEKGGHGFGLGKNGTSKSWSTSLANWLKENSLID